ncbi:TPA: hypothetical protein ACXDAZ_002688 [Clostridium botulinum]
MLNLNKVDKLNREYKGKFFTNNCGDKIEIIRFYIDCNEIYCSYKNNRYSNTAIYGAIWKYFGKRLILQ